MAGPFKILYPVRKDGKLVTSGSIELPKDEAQILLDRGIIQTFSEALGEGTPSDDESTGTQNRDNAGSVNDDDLDSEMLRVFGEDLTRDLAEGGFKSVDQVRSASEEELLAVKGIGDKRYEEIRRRSDKGGAQ